MSTLNSYTPHTHAMYVCMQIYIHTHVRIQIKGTAAEFKVQELLEVG